MPDSTISLGYTNATGIQTVHQGGQPAESFWPQDSCEHEYK